MEPQPADSRCSPLFILFLSEGSYTLSLPEKVSAAGLRTMTVLPSHCKLQPYESLKATTRVPGSSSSNKLIRTCYTHCGTLHFEYQTAYKRAMIGASSYVYLF